MGLVNMDTGYIDSIDVKKCTARVRMHENDNRYTREMHILVSASKIDNEFEVFRKDTPVVFFTIPGTDKGFIVGTWYTLKNPTPPDVSEKSKYFKFPGGTIHLDKDIGKLEIELLDSIIIKTPKIKIMSDIDISGEISLNGNMKISDKLEVGEVNIEKNIAIGGDLKVSGNTNTTGVTTTEGGRKL